MGEGRRPSPAARPGGPGLRQFIAMRPQISRKTTVLEAVEKTSAGLREKITPDVASEPAPAGEAPEIFTDRTLVASQETDRGPQDQDVEKAAAPAGGL